jgi:hypothetical protein
MPAGITSVEWDEASQLATINYARKPPVTFSASQIPGNVPKTVPAYLAWADANVQSLLNSKGFEAFIKIKIRSVDAAGFVTLNFIISETQELLDAYVFHDTLGPPNLPSRSARALSQ